MASQLLMFNMQYWEGKFHIVIVKVSVLNKKLCNLFVSVDNI